MADVSHLAIWSALKSVKGMGPSRLTEIALMVSQQGLTIAEAIREMNSSLLTKLQPEIARVMRENSPHEQLPHGVHVLSPESDLYPGQRLDPRLPLSPILYFSGNGSLLSAPGVAVSGSRKSSLGALRYVRSLVELLTAHGLNVVSGHAAGVDEMAHVTALNSGGTTTIVAAEGLARFKVRKSLKEADEASYVVVSEFEPAEAWTSFRAMKRNSAIAALADVVVVVAAGFTGGSRAQAELCLRAGKKVLVPNVHTLDAEGNQELIKMGAIPLDPLRPEEVIDHLQARPREGSVAKQMNFLDS